jgi:glycosyltransferase involved in cell wall biosynthesis
MSQPRRVNVLYCENNTDGTIGGSYYSLLFLIKGLDQSRYRPIVVFYTDNSLIDAYRRAGAETLVWPRAVPFTFGTRLNPKALRPVALALQKALNVVQGFLRPALRRAWFLVTRRISLVHLNNSVLHSHDWMLAAQLTGTPAVTHERGINNRFPPAARYFGRRLGAVICISEAVRLNMIERGANLGNLRTIHNGLDPDALLFQTPPAELRARLNVPADAPLIGMIGNIREWKGQETVIRALARVHREFPNLRCVLVGDTAPGDREYGEKLRALVAAEGLDQHVIFAGFQQYVADFLTMFDIVVHASVLPEPFGRVVLEAMACRRPVIGSRAGGITEIIDEGVTGLTFPAGDDAQLAAAVLRLLRDPREARCMGERGRERLVNHFTIASNVAATQQIYESLIDRRL